MPLVTQYVHRFFVQVIRVAVDNSHIPGLSKTRQVRAQSSFDEGRAVRVRLIDPLQ
jgi:hypothetical protein